jgi:hypothetical protein
MFEDHLYIKRKYFSPILNSKFKKRDTVFDLKSNSPFPDLCKITDEINPSSKNIYGYIFGNPLPSSYETLGELEKNGYVNSADDISTEINWTLITIRKYKKEILLFIEYKQIYEDAFLLGNYEKAEEYLTKIENDICFSLWSLENRFLLNEFSKSPESHKAFLSDFNSKNRGFFTPDLAYYLSQRSEKNFSVLKYNSDINNVLSRLRGKQGEANKQFYYLRLNYFENLNYSQYKEILSFDSYHSVIDRYITLNKLLKLISTDPDTKPEYLPFIVSRINYLIKKFDDNFLKPVFIASNPSQLDNYKDLTFDLKTIDYYTSGLYKEAIEELKKKLKTYPSRFEYYLLYVKSFVYSKSELVLPNSNKCFQNSIIIELYNQVSKKSNPQNSATNISRITKNLVSFEIADGLHSFYDSEFNHSDFWTKYNLLSLSFENPLLSLIYQDAEHSKEFISKLALKSPKSITIEYFLQKNNEDLNKTFDSLEIPEHTKKVELAKFHQSKELYEKASLIWEDLIKTKYEIVPVLETSIRNLFLCYLKLNKLDKAISLFVDNYLVNQFIIQKIDCSEIHLEIRKNKFRNVNPTIDLPIFYSISNADENEIHRTYELFNDSLGIEKSSQIDETKLSIDINKLIIFFNLTCNTEIFKHSDYINGTKEGLTERISICRKLQIIDKENAEAYKFELNQLTNILIIQEGIQQLDESKIYVNEQGLINNELKDYEGLFGRYKTISNIFKKDSNLLIYFPESGVIASLDKDNSGENSESKSKFSKHPLKDTFKEIFDVIKDKFLNSKFGISAYLSTRIRHGVLLGEVRPIFEKLNLIAQYDKIEKVYREINFWNKRYTNIHQPQIKILQDELILLSTKVDSLIYDLLKKNLQIQLDDENKDGWFDYHFDDITLTLHSINLSETKDYQEFIRKVIEILWHRTDENLENIREKIQKDVKNSFNEALSSCSSELRQKLPYTSIPDVYTNITTCSTEVQNTIDRIASWFNRTGSQTSDFNFIKVINIVFEKVKQSSRHLNLTLNVENDITLKGEFYSHIADLFRIFLDNALTHSVQSINIIGCEITIDIKDNWAEIKIINENPDPEKIGDLGKQNEQKINIKKISSEDKSGLHKASKIIKSDLKFEGNECYRSIDEKGRYCVDLKINIENLVL